VDRHDRKELIERPEIRQRLVTESSRGYNCTYIYSNLLGNEAGRIIYDGEILIAQSGELIARNQRFTFDDFDILSAVVDVENYLYATSQAAQTTLRSALGAAELDELLAEREKINEQLQNLLDTQTDPWGIKVSAVEVKHVDLPNEMQRAMARQAEAERERRAKVIAAEGEYQAATRLGEAAEIMEASPITLQLRYLQTLREIAVENNSTTLFPIPLDLFEPFKRLMTGGASGQGGSDSTPSEGGA